MEMQASVWYRQDRLEDATSEVLYAIEIFEKLGAANDVGGGGVQGATLGQLGATTKFRESLFKEKSTIRRFIGCGVF